MTGVRVVQMFVALLALAACAAAHAEGTESPRSKSIDNIVNVHDLGAVGDGSAALADSRFIRKYGRLDDPENHLLPDVRYRAGWDTRDFVAIQSALDYAGKHGKEVYVPAGKYVLSRPLLFKYDGMKVFGDGMHKSLIYQASRADGQNWQDEPRDTAFVKVGMIAHHTTDYGTGKKWPKTLHITISGCEISRLGFIGRGGAGRWMGQPGNESDNAGILIAGTQRTLGRGQLHPSLFLYRL